MFRFFNVPLLCLISGLSLIACDDKEHSISNIVDLSGFTMGTTYNIKINQIDETIDKKLLKNEIENILLQIDNQMSTYKEHSELSILNHSQSIEWMDISEDLYNVISTAMTISEKTNGAFDITIGPIVNLWGFGPEERTEHIPSDEVIMAVLNSTGYEFLHLRNSPYAIKKDKKDIYMDLSGIAKGYAVDKIAERLDQLVIKNYMVEVGGEIRAKAINPKNVPWQIGIEKPSFEQRTVQELVSLNNLAMATSGDYRNYFEQNGKYYSHTINPVTGHPVTHQLASVTIFHQSAMFADALATALLVLGPEVGMQFAEQENLAALFIIRKDNFFIEKESKALQKKEIIIKNN